jgi:hypothetical protein
LFWIEFDLMPREKGKLVSTEALIEIWDKRNAEKYL